MTEAFYTGVVEGMTKIAAKKRDESPHALPRDVAMAGGGAALVAGSRHRLLGTKRVYHGTTADRWREIKRHGLDPKFGGTGAATHSGAKSFQEGSRGKVHVTSSKPSARFFARYNASKTGKKGKVVAMNMDYGKYKRMEIDPDMLAGPAPDFLKRHLATRGTEAVTPAEIKGSKASLGAKARRRLSKLPDYVRKHPGRFGLGALGLGAGAYLAQKGARNLAARYRGRKDRD